MVLSMMMLPNLFLSLSLILSFFCLFMLESSWSKYQLSMYLSWHTRQEEAPQDARFLTYLIIYNGIIDLISFITFKYSYMMYWPLIWHDIFVTLGGFLLVYFLFFLFLPWIMFVPSGFRDDVSILILTVL